MTNLLVMDDLKARHNLKVYQVLEWRAWMEWAGGNDWAGYVDALAKEGEKGAIVSLDQQGKSYPKDWEWQGEHWEIAR